MAKVIISDVKYRKNSNSSTKIILSDYGVLRDNYNIRVTDAFVTIALIEPSDKTRAAYYKNRLIESFKTDETGAADINITDILCEAAAERDSNAGLDIDDLAESQIDKARTGITVEYEYGEIDADAHAFIERQVGGGGLSVEVDNGKVRYYNRDISARSGGISSEVVRHYSTAMAGSGRLLLGESVNLPNFRCGKGFRLNLHQYVLRSGKDGAYFYIDAAGEAHKLSDKYYFIENNSRHYVNKSDVELAIDGKLSISLNGNIYEVKRECVSESGHELITELSGIKGVDFVEQKSEEYAAMRDRREQLDTALNGLRQDAFGIESSIEALRAEAVSLDKLKIALEKDKKAIIRRVNLLKNSEKLRKYENDLSKNERDYQEKTKYSRTLLNYINSTTSFGNEWLCPNGISTSSDTNKCRYYNEIFNYPDGKRCVKNGAGFCLFAHQVNEQNFLENKRYSYEFNDEFSVDGKVFAGAIAARNALIVKRISVNGLYTISPDGSLIAENDNTPDKISGITVHKELAAGLGGIEFGGDAVITLLELSSQYERLNEEIAKIDLRAALNGSAVNSVEKALEQLAANYDDGAEVGKNTIFADYKLLHSKLELTNKQIDNYAHELEKCDKTLAYYDANMPSAYIRGGDSTLCFAPIFGKAEPMVLTDVIQGDKRLHIEYTGDRLTAVTDGEKDLLCLEYTGELLTKIIAEGGSSVSYRYRGEKLTAIESGDETIYLSYRGDLLREVKGSLGLSAAIEYSGGRAAKILDKYYYDSIGADTGPAKIDSATPFKTTRVTELAYSGAYTVKTSRYELDLSGSAGDKDIVIYQFDKLGRVTCAYKKDETFNYVRYGKRRAYTVRALPYGRKLGISDADTRQYEYYLGDGADIAEVDYLRRLNNYSAFAVIGGMTEDSFVNTKEFLVDISGVDGESYMLTAAAKADAAYTCACRSTDYNPETSEAEKHSDSFTILGGTKRKFELRVKITYLNGDFSVQSGSFDWKITDRQRIAFPVAIAKGKVSELKEIRIIADYTDNIGLCTIDSIELQEADREYTEFNDDGAITYSESTADNVKYTYIYDAEKRLYKVIAVKNGNEYVKTCEYAPDGSLKHVIDFDGIVSESRYDKKDNIATKLAYNAAQPLIKYKSVTRKDETGADIAVMDACAKGIAEGYEYDDDGNIKEIIGANGMLTAYGYDDAGRLTGVTACADGVTNENVFGYSLGLVTTLDHNGLNYGLEYDGRGEATAITIAGREYSRVRRDPIARTVESINALGESVKAYVDRRGNLVRAVYKKNGAETLLSECEYDRIGNLVKSVDYGAGEPYVSEYSYDRRGEIESVSENGVSESVLRDADGKPISRRIRIDAEELEYRCEYSDGFEPRLKNMAVAGSGNQHCSYDFLHRITLYMKSHLSKRVRYLGYGESASDVVSYTEDCIDDKIILRTRYIYDISGNIERVIDNGLEKVRYRYDGLNRLVREDNRALNRSYVFVYDAGGNITEKFTYEYTLTEELGTALDCKRNGFIALAWRDCMTEYGGEECVYDAMGNPTVYRSRVLEWANGRQLREFDSGRVSYRYLSNGKRVSKSCGGVTTVYRWLGDELLAEERNGERLTYIYGVDGVSGFKYRGEEYSYIKSVLGDVIRITDANGLVLAKYKYDAWGNHRVYAVLDGESVDITDNSVEHIAHINPIRYRSYYYDTEAGLCYLMSRYYDPEVGRFINADDPSFLEPESINGLNLFAYCNNNPVMNIDPTGCWSWSAFWKGLGLAFTSIAAIAISVATFGAGTPLAMGIVAGVTLGAGILTGVNAVATFVEAGIGYNFVRDGIFAGNSTAYNWYAGITAGIAAVGTIVLGVYQNTGQFKAAKAGRNYLGKDIRKQDLDVGFQMMG